MSSDFSTDRTSWERFRAARERSLAEPHGWLTLTSFAWLPEAPSPLGSVPGLWSTDGGSAVLTPRGPGLSFIDSGEPVDSPATARLEDEESLLWVQYGGEGDQVAVELARRSGRYAIRTRDSASPVLTGFSGVPTFDYRPDLVLSGRFSAYPQPVDRTIETAHPLVSGIHRSVGEVVFQLPGLDQEVRLEAADEGPGRLGITFYDTTNDAATAGWRRLTVTGPEPDGSVTLDFNRTINYPSAFTPFGTCPKPVHGNRIGAPVEAGEQKPPPYPASA